MCTTSEKWKNFRHNSKAHLFLAIVAIIFLFAVLVLTIKETSCLAGHWEWGTPSTIAKGTVYKFTCDKLGSL